ncbi:sensor histidine kinase [Ramlibacter sp. MMS24-I3-19]|uniref:sensor histidine kinase n=1 Tax=Ramlibacter sp. MMS24-I3-19 TaxID=3416606 RepID=UPI003CFE69F6
MLLTLLMGAIVAAALVQLTRPKPPLGVIEITQAGFIKSDDPRAPGPQAEWVTRTLPDSWSVSNPGQSGYGWYRMLLVLPDAPVEEWGAYLPTVSTTHHLFINGVDVGGGAMSGPFQRTMGTPQINLIPPSLLNAGRNEILLRLRVAPNLRGGLGPLLVGPHPSVEPLYERDLLVRVTLPRALNLALIFVGVLVLLLWLRRPSESIYGVFAALAIVWSLRNFLYTVSLPIGSNVWEALVLGSLALVETLLWMFVLRYTGKAPPTFERWALTGALVSLPLLASLHSSVVSALRLPWYLGCTVFSLFVIVLLIRHLYARRPEQPGPWLVLGAMLVMLLLGLTDLAVSAHLLQFGPAARMSYGAPLLLCAFVYALADNYFGTYEEARALNAELEQRVQHRARQLEITYERVRALEHAAILASERERIMKDMHDGIGSHLIAAVDAVERGSASPHTVAALLRECIDDLRLMIDSLEPDDVALQTSLGNLRYRLEPRLRAAGIALQWDVDDAVNIPSGISVLQILRIVQEAVANVLKHAEATLLHVSCRLEEERLVLRIADNGHGAAGHVEKTGDPMHRGIHNMRMRAQQLNGEFEIAERSPGTEVTIRVPVSA